VRRTGPCCSRQHIQSQAPQLSLIEQVVAKITPPGLPLFANKQIGADQTRYFRASHRADPILNALT
jgi:hypothetical protein